MTQREFYTAVMELETIDAELRDAACELLNKLNAKQVTARNRDSEKRATENAPIMAAITSFLKEAEEPKLTSEIATAVNISTSKASALLRKLAEDGLVIASDVKVPKSGIRKAYQMA